MEYDLDAISRDEEMKTAALAVDAEFSFSSSHYRVKRECMQRQRKFAFYLVANGVNNETVWIFSVAGSRASGIKHCMLLFNLPCAER